MLIGILGANGKLGRLICDELVMQNIKYQIIGRDMIFNDNVDCNVDCIVDVSSADGTKNLLTKLLALNLSIPLIIGTTGILPYELITEYQKISQVVVCSNFSQGIKQINTLLENLSQGYWLTAQIIDSHHQHKIDSPSGTAKSFKEILDKKGIPTSIHSIREGSEIGYHQIILSASSEQITLSHQAMDRRIFAKGCVQYILKVCRD
jgi:4-hydroxy-tetrahydrodipicolinate reductase